MPFILKVNGTNVIPPPIDASVFESTFNHTTLTGKPFKLANKTDITDSNLFFSVHFNHKVSESVKSNISAALIKAYVDQHPGEWQE